MAGTAVAARLLTADDFLAYPEDPGGRKLELLDGRVVVVSQPGFEHGAIAGNTRDALSAFSRTHRLGRVGSDTGFKLRSDPDRVVNPDAFFASREAIRTIIDVVKAIPVAPTLAVEVMSPNDTAAEIASKVTEYLAAGSQRVWVVRPRQQTVTVHRADGAVRYLRTGDTLTSDDAGFAVDGFALPLADVFALE